jgi:hypothetical protein
MRGVVRAALLAGVAWLSCGSMAAQELPEPARDIQFWFGWDAREFERVFQEHNRALRGFEQPGQILTFNPPPYTWLSGTPIPPPDRFVIVDLGRRSPLIGDLWMPHERKRIFGR